MRTNHPGFSLPRLARHLPVAAAVALALTPAANAAVILVTNTADSGAGSLRDAMNFASANCGTDPSPSIEFNLGAGGPFVISPSSPLPQMFCGATAFNPTINGYTQAGASANTAAAGFNANLRVILDGSNVSYGGFCGIQFDTPFYGGKLTVKGLKIQDFAASYGGGHGVCGAVDLFGNILSNNAGYGAYMYSGGNVVGGPAAADRNVFVGNGEGGISVSSSGNTVENNFVGTMNGSSANPNTVGVYVGGASSVVTGNVISGNSDAGVSIYGDYGGTVISGNFIGTNSSGNAALGNGGGGIVIEDSANLSITGNLIGGNGVAGIAYNNSSDLTISGNYIGVNSGGTVIKNTIGIDAFCGGYTNIDDNVISSNQTAGVQMSGTWGNNVRNNTIAANGTTGVRIDEGSCFGERSYLSDNTISNNGGDGILLTGFTWGNQFVRTQSFGNGRKNINLNNASGILPNDAGDNDSGSNDQQNYPVISSVLQDGTDTTVNFTLDAQDGTYDVEFFANDAPGGPAGQTFVHTTTVVVYGGPVTTSTTFTGSWDNISATATGQASLNSSEYSPHKAALTAPASTVTPSLLSFGDVLVGSESADKASTVRSVGDQPLMIESIDTLGACGGSQFSALQAAVIPSLCYGGSFICSTTCAPETEYENGETCKVTARFAPQFPGFHSQTLYVCDNSANTPKTIQLQGNAILPPPITITPKSWDFGGIPVGEVSAPKKFTFTNVSYGTVQILDVQTTGEFDLVSTDCPAFLYGGNSCDAVVDFGPTQSGDAVGSVFALYTQMLGLQAVATEGEKAFTPSKVGAPLTGVGLAGGEIALPDAIELGALAVGSSTTHTVELRNTGSAAVTVASVTVSAPFTLINNCTAPIEPGTSCTLVIGFTAPAIGEFNGTLTVVSDAAGGSGEIPVHAVGQAVAAPLLTIVPTSLGFGDRVIGSQTGAQSVTITNIGGVTAELGLTIPSVDFLITSNTCGATLAPSASCLAQVAFRPLGFGLRVSSLVVTSNALGSPQAVGLGGTGCRPFVASGNRIGGNTNCAP
jgi:parallel beta-helix repeat protein